MLMESARAIYGRKVHGGERSGGVEFGVAATAEVEGKRFVVTRSVISGVAMAGALVSKSPTYCRRAAPPCVPQSS